MKTSTRCTDVTNVSQVPLVPLVPALSILINVYLMVNMRTVTWIQYLIYVSIGNGNGRDSIDSTLQLKTHVAVLDVVPSRPGRVRVVRLAQQQRRVAHARTSGRQVFDLTFVPLYCRPSLSRVFQIKSKTKEKQKEKKGKSTTTTRRGRPPLSILLGAAEYQFGVWNTFGVLETAAAIAVQVVNGRPVHLRRPPSRERVKNRWGKKK